MILILKSSVRDGTVGVLIVIIMSRTSLLRRRGSRFFCFIVATLLDCSSLGVLRLAAYFAT